MQFVKASERLPEIPEDTKCSKELALKIDGDYDTGRAYNGSNGVIFCGKKYNVLTEKAFEKIFWLDESPPASAVEEAARMYPLARCNYETILGSNDIVGHKRQAHITCAGIYTGEIEKGREAIDILKALCALKKHKDTVGKDEYYEKAQPEVWKIANKFLEKL